MTSLSGGNYDLRAIPLLRASPFNIPDERRLHMALKAYYDSSGKTDDPSHPVLVLAGVVAPERTWPLFETAWQAVLDKYRVPCLHMSKLIAGREPFVGWTEERRRNFILDSLNVLGKLIGESRLEVYSCGVVLDDYRRAKADFPLLEEKSVEAICVDICVGGLTPSPEDLDTPRFISLYFDRSESFLHKIMSVWISPEGTKAQRLEQGWPYQIACIVPVDSQAVKPIQAADLIAWPLRRHYAALVQGERNPHEWLYEACRLFSHNARFFDYDGLKERYDKPQ